MEFGYHHMSFRYVDKPESSTIEAITERIRWFDREGFAVFSLMDHLWQIPNNGRQDEPFLDCNTTLPALSRETSDIELSALVTYPHYREPGYLARIIASLDHISDGRAVFGFRRRCVRGCL